MPDFRAFAPDATATAATIVLGPDESHHLVTVNRCGRGDPVIAFDGRGREWTCECTDPSRTAALLAVRSTHQAAPLPAAITLAQALPKGAVMDDIIRQATEVGATRIVPLLSERTQVHLDGDRAERKIAKWRTASIEAAKQCGNPWLPEIAPLQELSAFLATNRSPTIGPAGGGARPPDGIQTRPEAAPHLGSVGHELRLVASLHTGAISLRKILAQHHSKYGQPPTRGVWLIGPEGDFSPAEMTAAIQAGFAPVTLGPLVLRSDTAAIVALGILRHELSAS